jgi:hypothetical protein
MKIIIDTDLAKVPGATVVDNVTSCVASSADANFPDENLRDDFTTNLWKAASGTTATITLQVSRGSAVMLMNTNATSVVIEAGSGESYANESGFAHEAGYVNADDEVAVIASYSLPGSGGRLWADYAEFTVPHIVTIALTAAAVPYAGIVRAGHVEEFRDPGRENSEGSIDYSVEKELNNGANYFRKRNVIRTYDNLSLFETRANAWKFKHAIFDAVGPKPLAMRIVQNASITDWEFVAFAKRSAPPQIDHLNAVYSRINFSLQEVI